MKGNKNVEDRTCRDQFNATVDGVQQRGRLVRSKHFRPDASYWRCHFGVSELNRIRQLSDKAAAEADTAGEAVQANTHRWNVYNISLAIQEKYDRANETPAARKKRRGVTDEISSAEAGALLRRTL